MFALPHATLIVLYPRQRQGGNCLAIALFDTIENMISTTNNERDSAAIQPPLTIRAATARACIHVVLRLSCYLGVSLTRVA